MKYWIISIYIILFSWVFTGFSQNIIEPLASVSVAADKLEVDNIGNIFCLNKGVIQKYNSQAQFSMKNSALALGEISGMDASNALKMILFFKDLSQVIYMDNLLSSRGEPIQLDVLGYYQTQSVCRSYNEGMWLFDQTTFELTRLTEQLTVSAQSGNLAQVIGEVPNISYMREVNKWLYALDPELGVLVFDWYGSYTKTIPIKGIEKFVIRSNRLFFMKDDKLQLFNLQTSKYGVLEIPDQNVIDFSVFEDNLVVLTENQLKVYRLIVE